MRMVANVTSTTVGVGRKKSNRPAKGESSERLLDAASAHMVERDTVDISVADIADRAGLNTQLIRYYFGSKEGMLLALLKRVATKAPNRSVRRRSPRRPPFQKLALTLFSASP